MISKLQRAVVTILLGLAVGSTWGFFEASQASKDAAIVLEVKQLQLPW